MSIISEIWRRLTGRREMAAGPEFLIRYFHPWHLFCCPQGVYVRDDEYFTELRERMLSVSEVSEYIHLSIATRIVGHSQKQVDQEDERFGSLQRKVCLGLLAEVETRAQAENAQYGAPVTLDRWTAYGENIPIGIEMIVCAVGHSWRGVVDIRRESSLLPAFVLTGNDGQRLVLPLLGVDRVTIYPTKGAISYKEGPTAHLDLLEPKWETWADSAGDALTAAQVEHARKQIEEG